jgi:actin-related protein 5
MGTAMTELLFECYWAPSVAYGIDALFSYRYNRGRSGLVVSSSHAATHLIPVLDSKPIMSGVSRLNWGGYHGAEWLFKLLRLKYPTFPGKMTDTQVQEFVREHCYVSQDFDDEMRSFLDWTGLDERDHIIQYPFTEHIVAEKTEEELARIAERKKESGRRLQEQAAKMRLDRLIRKEEELEYWKDLQSRLEGQSKKEIKRLLDEDEVADEAQLDKKIKDLEKSIRRARSKDIGGPDMEEEEEPPSFPLLDVPDDQLDEAGLKAKRHQRLMKSGVEARARAKLEKQQEQARIAEEQRLDRERRENDLEGWLADKRAARAVCAAHLDPLFDIYIYIYIPHQSPSGHGLTRRIGPPPEDARAGEDAGRSGKPQIPRLSNPHEDPRLPRLRHAGPETAPGRRRGR